MLRVKVEGMLADLTIIRPGCVVHHVQTIGVCLAFRGVGLEGKPYTLNP